MLRLFVALVLCGNAAGLSLNGGAATRRAVINVLGTSVVGAQVPAAFASAEGQQAAKATAAARKAAEEAAALPSNQLKIAREQLASVGSSLDSQEWYDLRATLQAMRPPESVDCYSVKESAEMNERDENQFVRMSAESISGDGEHSSTAL